MAGTNDESGRSRRTEIDLDLDGDHEDLDRGDDPWPGKRSATSAIARPRIAGDRPMHAPAKPRGRLGAAVTRDLAPARPARGSDAVVARLRDAERVRAALASMHGGGQPLRPDLAASFSRQLGVNLSDVVIHASGPASVAARDLGAQAFTAGNQIAFAPGRFAPDSPEGSYILAHELVHVAQQKVAGAELAAARMEFGPSDSPLEREAELGSAALLRGASFTVAQHRSFPAISMFQGKPPADGGGAGGGSQGQGGAPQAQGGAPQAQGGAPQGQGGAPQAQGGTPQAQGGAPQAQGGAPQGQGGAPQGQGGAPQGQGGAPQGQGGAPQTQGGAPQGPAQTGSSISTAADDINAELEKRADPAVKAKWKDTLTRIDTFRLQSLQFSYNPTGILHNLGQTLWPSDNVVEHWRQAFTNNPYGAGPDPGDQWQAGLEGLRGVVRLLSDVVGTLSNWASVLSGISAALALATSVTVIGGLGFGAIAAILGQVSVILNAVKVIADLIDLVIGAIQMIILAQRIKSAPKGSAERARLLTLMKKESADFTDGIVNTVGDIVATAIAAATMGIGAGAGAAAGDGLKSGLKAGTAEAGAEIGKLIKPIAAIKEAATTVKVVAQVSERVAALTAAQSAKGITAEAKLILRLNIDEILLSASQITKGGVDHIVDVPGELTKLAMKKAVAGAVTDFSGGALYSIETARGKAAGSMGPAGGPGATPGTGDNHQSVQSIHISAWPSLLPSIGDMRSRLQNAKIRMKTQFDAARGAVSPDKRREVDAAIEKLEQGRAQIKATASQEKDKAAGDAQKSQEQVDKANEAKSTQDQVKAKADAAKAQARAVAQNPTLSAKPTGVMAWIGSRLAEFQNWLLTKMLSGTDVTPEEAGAAGIAVQCLDGHHNDKTAEAAAGDADANADELTQAVAKARTGSDADLDYAVRSMADAQHWMDSLQDMDDSLAAFETSGAAYIAAARQQIIHEREVTGGQAKIDSTVVAPIIDGATDFQRRITDAAQDLHNQGVAAAGQGMAQLAAKASGADLSQPTQVSSQLIDADVASLQGYVTGALAQNAKARDAARALIGTTDYAAVPALAGELEKLIDSYNGLASGLQAHLAAGLSTIINTAAESLAAQVKAEQQGSAPAASGNPPPAASGGPNPNPAPPPTNP